MLDFLLQHAQAANVALSALMLVVWVVYLQIFLMNHLRSTRSVLHIDLGVAWSTRARCLVTNLSSSPVYVQGIVADISDGEITSRAVITDRDELAEDAVEEPLARTNRGTLAPGQTVDIGSLEQLARRARVRLDAHWEAKDIESCTITVIAVTSQKDRLVGASKRFAAERRGDRIVFSQANILTRQLKARHMRRRVHTLLQDHSRI